VSDLNKWLDENTISPLKYLLDAHYRILTEGTPGPWEVFPESDTIWKDSEALGGGMFTKRDTEFVLAARASWGLYWQVVSNAAAKRAELKRALDDPAHSYSPQGRCQLEQEIAMLTSILKPLEEANDNKNSSNS
jgi:hypothetical protein